MSVELFLKYIVHLNITFRCIISNKRFNRFSIALFNMVYYIIGYVFWLDNKVNFIQNYLNSINISIYLYKF